MQKTKYLGIIEGSLIGEEPQQLSVKMGPQVQSYTVTEYEYDTLVNKPYVNEITLNGQNMYLKSC